jgi:hypothetical protein
MIEDFITHGPSGSANLDRRFAAYMDVLSSVLAFLAFRGADLGQSIPYFHSAEPVGW